MAAFGAKQGTSTTAPTPAARDGKGANSEGEAPAGDVAKGIIAKGHKGTRKGFGA